MDAKERAEQCYSFPTGQIRHIHNIVWDSAQDKFWVMTGDNDAKSGIYLASHSWDTVTPVKIGAQKYRAVVAFPCNGGCIYATDSVTDLNHIYYLDAAGTLKDLGTINGSCIYGTETANHYVFSTTVESPEGRGLMSLLSYKLGSGIRSRDVHIVTVRKNDLAVKVVAKYKKDWWPLKLFQYGAVMFPKGQEQSNQLSHYIMACKQYDGQTLTIDLE